MKFGDIICYIISRDLEILMYYPDMEWASDYFHKYNTILNED